MKFSKYLSLIPLGKSRLLIYCALNDEFVVLRNFDSLDIEPETLERTHPEAYHALVKASGIIEDDFDEQKEVRKRIKACDSYSGNYTLHINPTLDCNFRCWYCYETHIKDSAMSLRTVEAVRRAITRILKDEKIKNFHLSFFGGEPLLQYENACRPIIEHAAKTCKDAVIEFSVHFTTNGYLLTPGMLDFLKDFPSGFQITLDGVQEDHDKVRFPKGGGGSYVQITRNVSEALRRGIRVILRFNYTADKLERIFDTVPFFESLDEEQKKYLSVDFQRVWQDGSRQDEDVSALPDLQRRFREIGIPNSSQEYFDYVNNSCYGDKWNYALINYNGDLYCCSARDFKPEKRAGYLADDGTFVWSDYKKRHDSIRFNRPGCRECRIAPICGGGCSQQHLEHDGEENYCIFGQGEQREQKINSALLTRFESRLADDCRK